MAQAIGQLALNVAINYAASVFFAPAKHGGRLRWKQIQARRQRAVDVSYTGGIEPRRKLYGNFRAGGLDCMPAVVTGFTGEILHRCIALSDGEIESVDGLYFNNDFVPAAAYSTDGAITSGTYSGYGHVFPHLGLASQNADTNAMAAPGWTQFHRGDGIAYVYMNFWFSPSVYNLGAPDVVVEGKGALVYDPRLDSSPGADPTNSSYKVFSTNPALQLADFLTWEAGGAESTGNILWSDVVTAANICEESVSIPDSATQDRYTSSIEVYAPQTLQERDQTIQLLARAMMGTCWFAGGKWHMRAGAYSAPVGTINDDDYLGPDLTIETAKPRASGAAFNTVRGTYIEPLEQTQPKGMPEVSTSSFVAEDGETVYSDLEFRTARTVYEAERNAIQALRMSRRRISISGLFKFRVWKFQLWDVVSVTLSKIGWSSQAARITRIRVRQNFTVELTLEEIDSADFDDPDPSDYVTPNAVAPPESASYVPNSPSGLVATSQASAIIFAWNPPINAPVGVLYRLYEYTISTPFSSATQIAPDTAQTSIIVPKADTTIRYYWITAVDPATGAESTQAPPTNGVPGNAATASSVLGALVIPGSATISGFSASLQTDTVTVTPTGGTPGYTYATTFTSGGTGITINNGTTASPYFSATGLSEGETRSGTARIRVTDSAGSPATFDVSVAVTISRGYGVTLVDSSLSSFGGSMSAAVCSYVVTSGRTVQLNPPGTSYDWLPAGGTTGDYDVMFDTVDTGDSGSSATNTWLSLSSSRAMINVRTPGEGSGTSTINMIVRIRVHATLTEVATCNVSMSSTIT